MLKKFKQLDIADKNLLLLCGATFFFSSAVQYFWFILPFASKFLGGSDTEVGLNFAAYIGVYGLACLIVSFHIEKFKAKKVLLYSCSANFILTLLLFLLVLKGNSISEYLSPVYISMAISAMLGIVVAFFWPTIMGWVATGFDGVRLNKRLSLYNMSWSSAAVIAPVLSGYMAEANYLIPIAAIIVTLAAVMILLSFTRCVSRMPIEKNTQSAPPTDILTVKKYRYLARVGLCAVFLCVGVLRSHLGLLFKFDLGFSESYFGWSMCFCLLANWIMFAVMGKSNYWHYKAWFVFAMQALTIAAMLLIINSSSAGLMFFATLLTGICGGFFYSSHMYYNITGRQKRQSLMAVHEFVIGISFCIGALLSGFISDNFGRYAPYKFIVIATIAAVMVQGAILMYKKPEK